MALHFTIALKPNGDKGWRLPRAKSEGEIDKVGLEQLDYEGAISQGLPIGSGAIESAHRYILQKRMKLLGTRWLAANADRMLALRVNRANDAWHN